MFVKNYDQALKYIFHSDNIDKKFYNIDRIRQVNFLLWNPDKNYKIIHVAWTNWKWSVSNMLFSVIKNAWKKVWCFTSPHLIDIRERIKTNDWLIWKKNFVKILNLILKINIELSYFEIITLISFEYFKQQNCEYAILEVWLWWLLDATNVVIPEISCITSIGNDHLDMLWPTLDDVAYNKAWIIKKWIPIVINIHNKIIENIAQKNQSKIIFSGDKFETNLIGDHQKDNAWLTFQICKYLWFSDNQIKSWLQKVYHPWRMQYVFDNLLVDWAHNIDWTNVMKKYLETIKSNYSDIVLCFSLKKWKEPLELVIDIFWQDRQYIVVGYENDKLEKISVLKNKLKSVNYQIKTPRQIKNLAKKNKKILYVVFGSLYIIGEFLK